VGQHQGTVTRYDVGGGQNDAASNGTEKAGWWWRPGSIKEKASMVTRFCSCKVKVGVGRKVGW